MVSVGYLKMIYKLNEDYFVRSLMEDDLDGNYPNWFDDQEVCRFNSHGKFNKTKSFFKKYIENINNQNCIVWAICHIEDGHIGNISLQNILFINRTAEFAIILGDKNHWNKGVGLLAGRMIIKHGFDKLNLEKIYCGTAATNQGMKKLALSLGMILEGNRRKHLFIEGERVDMMEFGVLRTEFEKI